SAYLSVKVRKWPVAGAPVASVYLRPRGHGFRATFRHGRPANPERVSYGVRNHSKPKQRLLRQKRRWPTLHVERLDHLRPGQYPGATVHRDKGASRPISSAKKA